MYKRSGHFLQGRFQAIIVEHGQELKYVTAYIHLNPARAGMVKKLIEYPWSSHRQYTGGVGGLAETERVLELFDANRRKAIKKYEEYVKQVAIETDDEKKARIYGDYVMGSESFVREIKLMFKGKKLPHDIANRGKIRKVYDKDDIIDTVKKFYKTKEKELLYKKGKWNREKGTLIYLLSTDAGMTYAAIGRILGDLNPGGVGRMFKKVRDENEK